MSQDPVRESVVVSVSPSELEAMIERAVVNAFADAGMFLEDSDDRREARADFTFVRRFRKAFEGASSRLGGAILITLAGGFIYILQLGARSILGK